MDSHTTKLFQDSKGKIHEPSPVLMPRTVSQPTVIVGVATWVGFRLSAVMDHDS